MLVTECSPEPCILGSNILSQHPALKPYYLKLKEVCQGDAYKEIQNKRHAEEKSSRSKLTFNKSKSCLENMSKLLAIEDKPNSILDQALVKTTKSEITPKADSKWNFDKFQVSENLFRKYKQITSVNICFLYRAPMSTAGIYK
jgi:hypothetical protein